MSGIKIDPDQVIYIHTTKVLKGYAVTLHFVRGKYEIQAIFSGQAIDRMRDHQRKNANRHLTKAQWLKFLGVK